MTILAIDLSVGSVLERNRNNHRMSYMHRRTYGNKARQHDCDWCGQSPRRLYGYGVGHAKLFCNLQCHDSYFC